MAIDHPIKDLLARLEPSETALLDWLVPQLDESYLREIAAMDGWNEEAFFQALKPIYERRPLPVPLTWMPREVLELGQWSSPDAPLAHSRGTRGHLLRAFCCGVLLQAGDAPETHELLFSESYTLVLLMESVLWLGKEASECALRFLCWRIARLPNEFEETPFFAMALLLLRAALFESDQDAADLDLLCEWVVAEEARVRTYLEDLYSGYMTEKEWLLGLTLIDTWNENWRMLARTLLLNPDKSFPETTAFTLHAIVQRLFSTTIVRMPEVTLEVRKQLP